MTRRLHLLIHNSMSPSTSSSGSIRIPTGPQIYDALMSKIEPELMRANLGALDAPYKDEAPEARAARYKRYSKAFIAYKKAFKDWSKQLNKAVKAYKTALFKTVETLSQSKQDAALQALELQLQSA